MPLKGTKKRLRCVHTFSRFQRLLRATVKPRQGKGFGRTAPAPAWWGGELVGELVVAFRASELVRLFRLGSPRLCP